MKIGIVGGTGNISTSFVPLLLKQGHEVVCFNRGKRGQAPAGARVIVGDRANEAEFERTMQQEKFDAAIDMICYNAAQAQSSIRALRGVKHFVHCSTVCTYGVQSDWLPVTEDHPLRPISDYGRGKVAADDVYREAFRQEKFPVTIIKPSTTYGPQMGMLRQVAWEFGWIDRVRKGKPILICDQGRARVQFLHVDDAALGFVGVLGKSHCLGQTYNLVRADFLTWAEYHRLTERVLGHEAELVSVPLAKLREDPKRFSLGIEIFGYDAHYNSEKLRRDVPEFKPAVSLEAGMRQVLEVMDRERRVPNSDSETWEDALISAARQ